MPQINAEEWQYKQQRQSTNVLDTINIRADITRRNTIIGYLTIIKTLVK